MGPRPIDLMSNYPSIDSEYRRWIRKTRTVKQALEVHGDDSLHEFVAHPLDAIAGAFWTGVVIALSFLAWLAMESTAGWVSAFFAILAAILAVFALSLLRSHFLRIPAIGRFVLIYADRIVVGRLKSSEVVYWDEIEDIIVRTSAGSPEHCVRFISHGASVELHIDTAEYGGSGEWTELRVKDGRRVRIPANSTSFYKDLSSSVQGEVSARRWPEAVEKLKTEHRVRFGPIGVGLKGLRIQNRFFRWNEFYSVWCERGALKVINNRGEFLGSSIPVEKIPNLAVALFLILKVSSGAISQDTP